MPLPGPAGVRCDISGKTTRARGRRSFDEHPPHAPPTSCSRRKIVAAGVLFCFAWLLPLLAFRNESVDKEAVQQKLGLQTGVRRVAWGGEAQTASAFVAIF